MSKRRKLTPEEITELNFKWLVGLRALLEHDDNIDRLVMWRDHLKEEVRLVKKMLQSDEYDPDTYEHVIGYKSPPIIKESPAVEYDISRLSNPIEEDCDEK